MFANTEPPTNTLYFLSAGVSTFTRFTNFSTFAFGSLFNIRSLYKSIKSFFNRSPNPGNVVDPPLKTIFSYIVIRESISHSCTHSKTNSLTPTLSTPTRLGSNMISGAMNRSLSTLILLPSGNSYDSAHAVVSLAKRNHLFLSFATKHTLSFISRIESTSFVRPTAYPLLPKSSINLSVTVRPAMSNRFVACLFVNPSITGTTCDTPSPLSSTNPVINPCEYNVSTACTCTNTPLNPKCVNIISTIFSRFFIGF
mmetsp:Transcript_7680/g.24045  ORF Transcript_7680/g.24045 Transcript_7680/m.24045 type:complete len:254 (+) Transcript_7680:202-963(+)